MKHTKMPFPGMGIPLVGQPKVIQKKDLERIALQYERQVCPHCGCAYFLMARELHTIPATDPENPTPGHPVHVRSKERAFCLQCHEPVRPPEAPFESQYVRKEDA